jgi:hypothetical protein
MGDNESAWASRQKVISHGAYCAVVVNRFAGDVVSIRNSELTPPRNSVPASVAMSSGRTGGHSDNWLGVWSAPFAV